MKIIFTLPFIIILVLTMYAPSVQAKPNTAEFDYWQEYDGWGPALYYKQTVDIHYVATNTWTLNSQDNGDGTWTIKQELTQKGTAYIYDSSSNLIDEKNFRVIEITHGIVDHEASWYHYSAFEYVDQWNYHWIIPSVYHFVGTQHDGPPYDAATSSWDYWVKGYGWSHLWP